MSFLFNGLFGSVVKKKGGGREAQVDFEEKSKDGNSNHVS
jgi:hypothetical protein